jgi:hypothetical protein
MASQFPWWALVSIMPALEPTGVITTPHDAARILDGSYQLGPLSLRPGERQFVEYVAHLQLGWEQAVSWPIIVESVSEGEYRTAAENAATPLLHRLCTLLALAWGEAWQVRVAPKDPAALSPRVPDAVLRPLERVPNHNPQIGMRAEEPLPSWIPGAWNRIEDGTEDKRTVSALAFWHQGVLLMPQHPSFALLAFVACIEALGPETAAGESDRFWKAVDRVAMPDEIALLKRARVYNLRSSTGHGGALHGIESQFGARLFLPINREDPVEEFMFSTLRLTARLSRQALLQTLMDRS